MLMMSPSSIRAIGPPTAASGETCPMEAPRDAPLKRPSVIKSYRRSKSHTCDRRCRIQHLSHSRTAFWSFITDDYNVSGYDLAAFDRCDRIFFAVKDSCRSFVYHHFFYDCGTFYDTAVRSDISFEDCKSTGLAVWIVDRADNFRIEVYTVFDIFAYCLCLLLSCILYGEVLFCSARS